MPASWERNQPVPYETDEIKYLKKRDQDEMCRSYGAKLRHAFLLLQRLSSSGAKIKPRIRFRKLLPFPTFSTSGATSKPHRGAPFLTDKSLVP